jgi:hypothetical protein
MADLQPVIDDGDPDSAAADFLVPRPDDPRIFSGRAAALAGILKMPLLGEQRIIDDSDRTARVRSS